MYLGEFQDQSAQDGLIDMTSIDVESSATEPEPDLLARAREA